MAVKTELGEPGFELWDRWSATSDKYQAREAATAWRSFKPAGGVNIGSLFHIAQQYGYQRNRNNYPVVVTPEEVAAREVMRKTGAKLLKSRREAAAAKADLIWNDSDDTLMARGHSIASHPYLIQKGIEAHGARLYHGSLIIGGMECDGALMISMSLNRRITSLQFINRDGEKRFLPDGEKGGYLIGALKSNQPVCICEGFATGCSIHNATGCTVVVAFDAGNLRKMAEALRAKQPHIPIIVCADDDHATPGNPGCAKATEAAEAVGGVVVMPDFGDDLPQDATDFNDMSELRGEEAVNRVICAGIEQARANDRQPSKNQKNENIARVELLPGSQIEIKAVSWLWEGWLASGKLHILGGAPGTGKTTIAMWLAATVADGKRWPDSTESPVGNVVIWSGEDDPADTLVPRLSLAGADLKRVYFVNVVRDANGTRTFDPARDIGPLQRTLSELGDVKLLIIDPIVSAVAGDSHKNAEVRRGLQPLAQLATSTGCALLGITHFSKGTAGRDPLERITGSLAFGALARVVLVAAKVEKEGEDEDEKSILVRAKSNIGPDHSGFVYELDQADLKNQPEIRASVVRWGEQVTGTARDLLSPPESSDEENEASSRTYAKGFLRGLLCRGAVRSTEVLALATAAGLSEITTRRVQKKMGIIARKVGGYFGKEEPHWTWELPKAEDDQDDQHQQAHGEAENEFKEEGVHEKTVITFSKVDHLQDEEEVEEEI
jgi:putative DNA primase/helicase